MTNAMTMNLTHTGTASSTASSVAHSTASSFKSLLTRSVTLGRELKELTGCNTDELREVLPLLLPCLMSDASNDVSVHLGGNDWRFIAVQSNLEGTTLADTILADELKNDPYILGCFNASFLADHCSVPLSLIEIIQKAEAYEDLGQHLIDTPNCVDAIAKGYAAADGYGHHFASYDGDTHELTSEPFLAFNQG